jgi:cytidylate kinase
LLTKPEELTVVNDIVYDYNQHQPVVLLRGKDITEKLYEAHLDEAASMVSAVAAVREALLPVQQDIAHRYDIIADGRDCGSHVFPQADIKFFLTADKEIRAQRLLKDVKRRESKADICLIRKNLEQRDLRDQTRKVAPLLVPENAIVVDNTLMNEEETLQRLIDYVEASNS